MPTWLESIIAALVTGFVNKHQRESVDGKAAVATQVAPLPAMTAIGIITMTDFGNDADAAIAVISVLLSAGCLIHT